MLLEDVIKNLRREGIWGDLGYRDQMDRGRLYVVCAKDLKQCELEDAFRPFGGLEFVKLNVDANGRSKGCAFVKFYSEEVSYKAMKGLHGQELAGKPLKVMIAKSRESR